MTAGNMQIPDDHIVVLSAPHRGLVFDFHDGIRFVVM